MRIWGVINRFFGYASIVLAIGYSIGTLVDLVRHAFVFGELDLFAPLTFVFPLSCSLGFHIEAAISQRFLCRLCLAQEQPD
jgi:hypothetical protein